MTERKHHLDKPAIALLLVCCLFWGFQQVLIKSTVAEVPPLWQASLRFAGATGVLLNEPLTLQLVLALCGAAAGIVLVNRRPAPAVAAFERSA